MKAPRLDAIQITNFRSVRGTVSIPLNAPVVLLHGTNGSGKSSVMSAIELALSGGVSGIRETDHAHLVHHGDQEARVDLVSSGGEHSVRVSDGELKGDGLLATNDARFFVERCYLQQRTLSRLLEIYQDGSAESQLTQFVNDLLGLDELEAILQGTHQLTHRRRLVKALPELGTLEFERDAATTEIERRRESLNDLSKARAENSSRLRAILVELEAPADVDSNTEAFLVGASREGELVDLAAQRRDLLAMQRQAHSLGGAEEAKSVAALVAAASDARDAATAWRETHGRALEEVLAGLRRRFPALPDAGTAKDPVAVLEGALAEVGPEAEHLRKMLDADERLRGDLGRLDASIAEAETRLQEIEAQLAESGSVTDAEDLAKALAALLPHIHSDDCPVCERAFREVSDEPLVAHLAVRVSEFSERAERISSLAKARLEAANDLRRLDEERGQARRQLLAEEARADSRSELAFLEDARGRLVALEAGVAKGANVTRALADAERALVHAEERSRAYAELVAAVRGLVETDGRSDLDVENLNDALASMIDGLDSRVALAERVERLRSEGLRCLRAASEQMAEESRLEREIAAVETRRRDRRESIGAIDERRNRLWDFQRAAEATRKQIIRRVFNESLNGVWRDLFVRLAPDEPFVPTFRAPDTERSRIIAELATTYRGSDQEAGSPDTMLSSGNLNTAALTLFLALNLSVEPRLPWLLLDDPVQSMDEVHIQQFAALLRTLSKGQGRQVIIAVHERALFEYLSLELSAAQPEDVLVTVELSRPYGSATVARPSRLQYVPDRALTVAERSA